MPSAEYMREYRKRPGVRERELRDKREYDVWHREQNRARWKRRNETRQAAKAEWYRANAERITKDRKTRRDYFAKFGKPPKHTHRHYRYHMPTLAEMAEALRTGVDPFGDLKAYRQAAAKRRVESGEAKRAAKRAAATRKKRRADDAIWDAYAERFGAIFGGISSRDFRLMAKSLKDGVDHLADRRAQDAARHEEFEREEAANAAKFQEAIKREAERQAKAEGPFSIKTERAYTRLIKDRKLFEGACDLRWQEYFAFREANKCARLTANDLRYAGQYTVCPVPHRDQP